MLPDPFDSPYVTHERARAHPDYAFYSAVDLLGLAQVTGLMSGSADPPLLTWWSSYVTDAGHHAAGPFSAVATSAFRDADARLGVLLDAMHARGILDSTLILLTADHGFEAAREDRTGDWEPALSAALDPLGVDWVDEGPGFLYLGVQP
jgi:membrane-anchored protein YejM (alkaline phosphatase superfamily)